MEKPNRLVVVDIGSHKLEELLVLLGPFSRQFGVYAKWAARKCLKAILRANFSTLSKIGRQMEVIRYYFLTRREYHLQVISIEPNTSVVQPYIEKLSKKHLVHYLPAAVLGHDAETDVELKALFFYNHSISSSIYKRDRLPNHEKARVCIGLKFDLLWENLIKIGALNTDDPFLLRMNCEGAELGVIEGCLHKGLKPICIIGSIGDVGKIHGKQANDKTREILDEMETPYFYFKGDDPSTWYDMITVWDKYTSSYRKK